MESNLSRSTTDLTVEQSESVNYFRVDLESDSDDDYGSLSSIETTSTSVLKVNLYKLLIVLLLK